MPIYCQGQKIEKVTQKLSKLEPSLGRERLSSSFAVFKVKVKCKDEICFLDKTRLGTLGLI
jgi:hypothetical protein